MFSSNAEAALAYAAMGWPIFPLHYVVKGGACSCGHSDCLNIGKHPVTKNGVKDASTDSIQIELWWKTSPHYNIGYATGFGGRIVMDVDTYGVRPRSTVPKSGDKTLATLEASYGPTIDTLRCKTGGGGTHYHFATIHEIKNSRDQVGADIDVRGIGGYVILPPSNHRSGGRYEWINWNTPLAGLPDWLATRMASKGISASDVEALQPEVIAEAKSAERDRLTPEQLLKLLDFIPADCDRETWWRVGAALKTEMGEKGYDVWRSWSQKCKDPGRGWSETIGDAQWRSFEHKGITAGTIWQFAKDGGFKGFDKEAAKELKNDYVYVIRTKRFVELARMIELDKEQFDARHSPAFQRGAPSSHFLRDEENKRLDEPTYWPKKERIVWEDGKECLNLWTPHPIEPKNGDVGPFLEHIAYLFPDPVEQKILIDYLSYQIQNPGAKVHWAILMYGMQGTGKSYFGTVLKSILGERNVRAINNEMLHENFTGWIKDKQFIIVEEMMAGKRLELMNKLKPMITEPWLTIREMHKEGYELKNRCNFLFLTNHKDAVLIDNEDRRYCILKSEVEPRSPENYAYLFDWSRRHAAEIAYFFLENSLNLFQPYAHAPMTAGKAEMIEETRGEVDTAVKERVDCGLEPFQNDIVQPSEIVKKLQLYGINTTPKGLGRAFARLGYHQFEVWLGKGKARIWVVRNWERYEGAPPEEMRRRWEADIKGVPYESKIQ